MLDDTEGVSENSEKDGVQEITDTGPSRPRRKRETPSASFYFARV